MKPLPQCNDAELLRAYADEKSEAAFGELVRRQLNLVYSVALRQCGGQAPLAEDVTQRVFTDLARKAPSLSGYAVLGGWLYRRAQFVASDVVRAEHRRRAREQEAQAMQEISRPVVGDAEWQKLAPVLDQVVGELPARDRDAVVLRFMEGRPFADIGATLRLTEDAARMRVERALEKLRAALARRGITSASAALGVALANQAAAAAPAALAASVTGAALAGAAVGAGAGGGAGALLTILTMSKIKTGIVSAIVAVAVVGVGGVWWLQRENAALQRERADLQRQNAELKIAAEKQNRRAPDLAVKAPPPASTEAPAPTPTPAGPPAAAGPAFGFAPTGGDALTEMTPVDKLVNAGRGTPVAAVQTFLWAARKGNDDEVAASLVLNQTAREKAEAWRAALPPEAQAKYAVLEKLPGLFLTEEIVRKAAGVKVLDAIDHGTGMVPVRMQTLDQNGRVGGSDLMMQQGPTGWQVIVPDTMIDGMRKSAERKAGNPPARVDGAGR